MYQFQLKASGEILEIKKAHFHGPFLMNNQG